MPEIIRKEVFVYKGHRYDSLKDIRTVVENELGRFIDQVPDLGPKDRLKLHAAMIKHRQAIVEALTVTIEEAEGYDDSNIFDI